MKESLINSFSEKKKHVRITNLCNNNCIFCLNAESRPKAHVNLKEIQEELKAGIRDGCSRAILSGGEASIHPNFIDIIKFAKKLGYRKIQTISNGRRYAYRNFLVKAKNAGLNEITFSIHGDSPELHDSLTMSGGSFLQEIRGIRNALREGLIVSTDIVLSKENYSRFPKIISFLLNQGIREFDILYPFPFGNAWKNKEDVYFDIEKNLNPLHEGISLALKNSAVVWTNRLPAKYLEGFESLIQEPSKIVEEVMSRKEMFEAYLKGKNSLNCSGERCNFCNMSDFCKALSRFKQEKKLPTHKKPKCIAMEYSYPAPFFQINQDFDKELKEFILGFVKSTSVKSIRCSKCKYKNECLGPSVYYVRLEGFTKINPI